jgi:hypothetical protein
MKEPGWIHASLIDNKGAAIYTIDARLSCKSCALSSFRYIIPITSTLAI